jgi:hypothetical protein
VRRFVESSHTLQILGVAAFPVRSRLRVHAGRPDNIDRLYDVLGTKPSGKDDGGADQLDDPTTEAPVVRYAQRADLPVRRTMAVQQQIIRNAS